MIPRTLSILAKLPMTLPGTTMMLVLVVCMNTNIANAQFVDNFDSYANGTILSNPFIHNGWQGWDSNPAVSASVSNLLWSSGPNSVAIAPTSDLVNQMGNPALGKWNFTVDQYIPSGSVGDQYFIMLNIYSPPIWYNWSVQLRFSGATRMVTDDFDPSWLGTPIIYDAWVPIQMIIDLNTDTLEQYYNCVLIPNAGASWSGRNGPVGAPAIGAVNLFSNNAQTIYYDNVSLAVFVPAVPGALLTVAPGIIISGGLADLSCSDNVSLVLFRDPNSTAAVTQFVLTATSSTATPTTFEFVLEGRCVSRPNVVQRVEFYNYVTGAYEVVDEQNAVRTPKDLSVTVVTPVGDLSRFVDQATSEIRARVRYRADSPRANFSSRTDQAIWMIQ